MEELRYPIGKYSFSGEFTDEVRQGWIRDIADLPGQLRQAVSGLTEEQLNTPYRPGGWTVRQVVHHLADSHMNCYIRFKLALTEDVPTIKPYEEAEWAELFDGKAGPVEDSLQLLDFLHRRWVRLLQSMTPEQYERAFDHPANGRTTLNKALGSYSWHGRHHLAQITQLRIRETW
ncbi:YfiT family bacillithiol transferase [Brevibacillus fulvus]|uniref:Putative metal-dependent hydrolase JOD01_000859 n=1 Tax=Brevibacillus fulvus TaxID=1125967 RepID=A0A939BU85_9BACL|nr:bacillithiol transferase BstA [Brevibacillus fulvus]MBM7589261.1 putative damage-inducible protein DinB [Brevibacillus fulvus]